MSLLASYLLTAAGSQKTGWNISNASFKGTPVNYLTTTESNLGQVVFNDDGLKMYHIGNTSDSVYEYDLTTAYDISTASLLQSFSVKTQEANPKGLYFKPDGYKMYIVGYTTDYVREYNLSIAWDVSSASYLQGFYVGTQENIPTGVFFKPNGYKMYVIGYGTDYVHEYDLTIAWNISTASYLQGFYVGGQDSVPWQVFFKDDGYKMYIVGSTTDKVYEYDLSPAWDVSSASLSQSLQLQSTSPFLTSPLGLWFKPDGRVMYITDSGYHSIYQYQLSTDWDISSASYTTPTTNYYELSNYDTSPMDIFFTPDGYKMYTIGLSFDRVNEFDLTTAWDISTASRLQYFSVSTQDGTPYGLFFRPSDGKKMYIIGATNDRVYEYDLLPGWDISTASFLQSFYVGAQETTPTALYFRDDGYKMYIIGATSDRVHEYDLSPAWDVSSASFLQSFYIGGQEAAPWGLFFKPDGKKMYVSGYSSDGINEYDLSIAWDVSSASFSTFFSTHSEAVITRGLHFNNDGTKMYIANTTNAGNLWSYDL